MSSFMLYYRMRIYALAIVAIFSVLLTHIHAKPINRADFDDYPVEDSRSQLDTFNDNESFESGQVIKSLAFHSGRPRSRSYGMHRTGHYGNQGKSKYGSRTNSRHKGSKGTPLILGDHALAGNVVNVMGFVNPSFRPIGYKAANAAYRAQLGLPV
jgi:hypothetical protein